MFAIVRLDECGCVHDVCKRNGLNCDGNNNNNNNQSTILHWQSPIYSTLPHRINELKWNVKPITHLSLFLFLLFSIKLTKCVSTSEIDIFIDLTGMAEKSSTAFLVRLRSIEYLRCRIYFYFCNKKNRKQIAGMEGTLTDRGGDRDAWNFRDRSPLNLAIKITNMAWMPIEIASHCVSESLKCRKCVDLLGFHSN